MVSLVPCNLLTTQLSIPCTTPVPGMGALQGSLVAPVTARTREEGFVNSNPCSKKGQC